jgi:hypothetical protein
MKATTSRFTIALAVATVLAMPLSGMAQTPPQTPPPTPSQPAPAPPAPQQSAVEDAAKVHLTAARNTLSQLTQLPAAVQLQGEPRTQVSQLISNFNEMITTKVDWRASYAKVEANIDALLNQQPVPDEPARTGVGVAGASATLPEGAPAPAGSSATPSAVGTSGTAGIDPAIRAKLMEFRTHLDKFEAAASAGQPAAASSTTPSTTTMTTPTQTPPSGQASPAGQTPPANQPAPATQPPPTADVRPAPPEPEQEQPLADAEELLRHIDAIEAIVGAQAAAQAAAQANAGGAVGTAGTATGSTRTTVTGSDVRLSQEQVAQLRTHIAELRRLIEK